MKSRRVRTAGVLLGLALLLTGCAGPFGSGDDEKKEAPTLNTREAAVRADALLDGTLRSLPREVVWTHGETTTNACRDVLDTPVETTTVSRKRTVLTIISAERRDAFLQTVLRYWKSQGYKVSSVNKSDMPAVFVKTEDHFSLMLVMGYKGQAHFRVTSGCAEKSSLPNPTTKANGPDFSDRQIPRPYIKDDYWSLPEPLPDSGG